MSKELKKSKSVEGLVISKTTKSVKVQVALVRRHPKYGKIMKRSSYIWAHDESDSIVVGDKVLIKQSRPHSKMKRWECVSSVVNN